MNNPAFTDDNLRNSINLAFEENDLQQEQSQLWAIKSKPHQNLSYKLGLLTILVYVTGVNAGYMLDVCVELGEVS